MRVPALLAALLWPAAALAGPVESVIGADDRVIAGDDFPWASVGKVQVAGFDWRESCSGALIAPDLVITAAHCLANARTGRQAPDNDVHFLLGLKRDKNLGHAKAKCVALFGPLPDRTNPIFAFMANDAAVIRLDRELKGAPLAIASVKAAHPGAEISLAGYAMDRPYLPSVHNKCRITWSRNVLAASDCDANYGQSGGPALAVEGGETKIAGILVGLKPGAESYILPASRLAQFLAMEPCGE